MRPLLRVLASFALVMLLGVVFYYATKAPQIETKQRRFLQHHFAEIYKVPLKEVFIKTVYPLNGDREIGLTFFNINTATADYIRLNCVIDTSLQFSCDEENAQLRMLANNNRAFVLDDISLIKLVVFCTRVGLLNKHSLLDQLGIERSKGKSLEIRDPVVVAQDGVRKVIIYYLNTKPTVQNWSIGRIEVSFNINGSVSVLNVSNIDRVSEEPH